MRVRQPGQRGAGVPALLGAILSFQIGAAVAKSLFPVFGAVGTVGLRIGLSTLLLWLIWRPWRYPMDRALLRTVIPYGVSLGSLNLCFYCALARLPLGVVVAIEFSGPLALAFLGSRRRLDLLWASLVVAGLASLLAAPRSWHELDPLGLAFAFAAALFWALYVVSSQRIRRDLPSGPIAAFGMAAASLAILPFCLTAMAPALHRPVSLIAALLVAILSGALPYTLEMAALQRMSASAYGILSSLDPVLAALSGLVLLGEHLSPLRWMGIFCIVVAASGSVLGREGQGSALDPLKAEP